MDKENSLPRTRSSTLNNVFGSLVDPSPKKGVSPVTSAIGKSTSSASDFLTKATLLPPAAPPASGSGSSGSGSAEASTASVKLTPRKIFTVLKSSTPVPAPLPTPNSSTSSALPSKSSKDKTPSEKLEKTQNLIENVNLSINTTLNSLRQAKKAANDKRREEIAQLKLERLNEKLEAERYNAAAAAAKKDLLDMRTVLSNDFSKARVETEQKMRRERVQSLAQDSAFTSEVSILTIWLEKTLFNTNHHLPPNNNNSPHRYSVTTRRSSNSSKSSVADRALPSAP